MNMHLYFFKKERPKRKELCLVFEQITSALRCADDSTLIAVGHSINMAYTMFIQDFQNIDTFCQQPKAERIKFLQNLTVYEIHLTPQDQLTLLGFSLFGMWVSAQSEGDYELASQFSEELKYFSSRSNLALLEKHS